MSHLEKFPVKIESIEQRANEIPIGLKMMNVVDSWGMSNYGEGNVIAVIDSGCDYKHQDLRDNIIGGFNFTDNGLKADYHDSEHHGTHVSGIIAAKLNGSGVVGVAPKAKLLILKVIGPNGGNLVDLIEAVKYATKWEGSNGERVSIINMSLGVHDKSNELYETILKALNNNISVVAASGNDGDGKARTEEMMYPGYFDGVIQVGSLNRDYEISKFSNTNKHIDYVAPGSNILSTFPNNKYARLSGTSMAVPHITGSIALIRNILRKKGKKPDLNNIYNELNRLAKKITHEKMSEGKGFIVF